MSTPPVGAQLIIFGKKYPFEENADLVLDALKKAGYVAIEGGLKDPKVLKQKLDARGMKQGGLHSVPRNIQENTQGLIDALKVNNSTDISNSGCYDWKFATVADVGYTIKVLNDAGKKFRENGIHLHYHNHDIEFTTKVLGKRVMDILIDELDPNCCDLCVDVAWVMRGGDDPAEFLRKHKDKVGYLHFKDWDGTKWVPCGKGKVDFKSIKAVLPELTGARWIMVEQDQPAGDPIEDMAESRRFLKTLGI